MQAPRLGTEIHGEFSSADASALTETNSRILLYIAGTTTVYNLLSTDIVVITSLIVSSGAAITVSVYDGADATVDVGETVCQLLMAANTSQNLTMERIPHFCQPGTWPKVKGSAIGAIRVAFRGYIESQK